MKIFFDFSSEEMTRVPIWVKFPNLPLCCWSPSCLSKIASVLGKPIQCDQMTYNLSRLSYARVLVELDLREDLQHYVEVSLLSGRILHQKVVYETLPKLCNFCNVLGHTRLLCPKVAASTTTAANTLTVQAGKRSVFSCLGPQIHQHEMSTPTGTQEQSQPLPVQGTPEASSDTAIVITKQAPSVAPDGWITVERRRKSNKHTSSTPKGKEVIVVEAVSDVNSCKDLVPSVCAGVVGSPVRARAVVASVCAGVVSRAVPCFAPPNSGECILAKSSSDVPPLGDTIKSNGKHHN
jgi:hypothetical protein